MHRRTIGFTTLKWRPNKKADLGKLDAVHGHDLLHLFHAFVRDLDPNSLRDEQSGKYVSVDLLQPSGRTVLVALESGRFGEAGHTYDVQNHTVSHKRTTNDAATERNRLLCIVPPASDVALFVVEYVAGGSGGPTILKAFKDELIRKYGDDYWPMDRVYETQAWLALSNLNSLTAIYYKWNRDLGSATTPERKVLGRMERRLTPTKGMKSLPKSIWDDLRSGKIKGSTVMGSEIPEDDDLEPDELLAEATYNNRKKLVVLGNEKTPTVRIVMTDNGTAPHSDPEFVKLSLGHANDIEHGIKGSTLAATLAQGAWADDDLDKTWE